MKSAAASRPMGFLIGDLARLMRRRFERRLAGSDTGLTVSEARTLAMVEHYSGWRQTALADRMGIEPMTLSGFLDRLEAAGLVARSPDPNDRRAKLITLAPAAAPVLERIHEEMVTIRLEALEGFSEEEADRLYALLQRMHGNLCCCGPEELS